MVAVTGCAHRARGGGEGDEEGGAAERGALRRNGHLRAEEGRGGQRAVGSGHAGVSSTVPAKSMRTTNV
eukprot:5959250-Prymnesium_polylepis.1